MKIDISQVKANRFRDFDLYPIDPEQVERLRRSIHDLGFFSGLAVRPMPEDPTLYELAAGHHRLEAAKAEGLTHVEAVVEDYDDADMVAIMVRENITQRGYNAAAVLDSVAAQARLTAYAVFVSSDFDQNGDHVSKILLTSGLKSQKSLDTAKALIAKDGPGYAILYRAINGFDLEDRKANKDIETLKSTEIKEALASLKASGEMAKIVSEAYEAAKVVLDQAEAEAEAARRQAEAEAAKAAAKAKAEAEAKAEREAEAKKAADAARKAAQRAEKAQKAEAEAKAAELNAEAKKLAEERKAAEAQAKADAKAAQAKAKAAQAEAKAKAEEEAKARAAIDAQKALEATYDIRCMNVFRLVSHEKAFREVVLSETGLRFIPKDQQYHLALNIRQEIDSIEAKRGTDLGASTVALRVQDVLTEAMGIQRNIDEEERDTLLRGQHTTRVLQRWLTVKRALRQAVSALEAIAEEHKEWDYDKALFPIDRDAITTSRQLMEALQKLAEHTR